VHVGGGVLAWVSQVDPSLPVLNLYNERGRVPAPVPRVPSWGGRP
jgi:hypothetical protein